MGKVLNIKDVPRDAKSPKGRSNHILVSPEIGSKKVMVILNVYEPNMTQKHHHYHKIRDQVYVALEGSGTYDLDGKVFEITPGTVVFIKPGDKHGIKGSGPKGLKMLEINSDPHEVDMYDVPE